MRVPQAHSSNTSCTGSDVTMQHDKQTNSKVRPHIPTLSTTTKSIRSPLAPRLAGSPQPYISPSARQGPLTGLETTPNGALRENISTPVKAFLSSNITPRSGPRKARVDSASTTPAGTPNGTPNSSRPTSMVDDRHNTPKGGGNGLGISGAVNGTSRRPKSIISESNGLDQCYSKLSPRMEGNNGYGKMATSPESSPMFFYASDAKSSVSSQGPSQRSNASHKSPSMVSGNGADEHDSSSMLPPLRAATLPVEERPKAQFFHTDEITLIKDTMQKVARPVHNSPTTPTPRLATFNPTHKSTPQPRPPSPLKEQQISRSSSLKKVSPRNYTPLNHNSGVHQIELVSPIGQRAGSIDLGRRSSLSTPGSRRVSHATSNSIGSIDSNATRRRSLRLADPPTSFATPVNTTAAAEALSVDNTITKETVVKDNTDSLPIPQSPTKVALGQSKLQQMNELAANARRERKVLDLEISNSSLLAINRTLEREMRKQNSELRRYRRLSRSGRLSMATSKRSISAGGLSMLSETDTASDFSELPEEDDYVDEYSDDESLLDDGTLSPNTYAEHDARLRAKDEKRLQLDLSKHRELLVDSQKMNQSLKRCLGWTEDLIKEAQKALDYHVRVSDVEVGGRVLTPDEVEFDTLHGRGLLSPPHELIDPLASHVDLQHHVEHEIAGHNGVLDSTG